MPVFSKSSQLFVMQRVGYQWIPVVRLSVSPCTLRGRSAFRPIEHFRSVRRTLLPPAPIVHWSGLRKDRGKNRSSEVSVGLSRSWIGRCSWSVVYLNVVMTQLPLPVMLIAILGRHVRCTVMRFLFAVRLASETESFSVDNQQFMHSTPLPTDNEILLQTVLSNRDYLCRENICGWTCFEVIEIREGSLGVHIYQYSWILDICHGGLEYKGHGIVTTIAGYPWGA